MTTPTYPDHWATLAHDFDPQQHLIQIERFDKAKGKKVATDYLNVQNRLIWFIRDQRQLISAGLAKTAYTIQTEMVEHDREAGWAHFKTYVRDVLGNEATMYGSESMRDFPDYIEKASTKSLGRALLLLGYGTAFTAEIDEGDRMVDAPTPVTAATSASAAPVAHPASPTATIPATPATQETAPAPPAPERIALAEWCKAHGVTSDILAAYFNRHKYSTKNLDHVHRVQAELATPNAAAEIQIMQLAAQHLTTIEIFSQLMREQKIGSFAEFWRQYQSNCDDWNVFIGQYLHQKVSA
jgi:hypothetical protein